jgi:hypothetical protein
MTLRPGEKECMCRLMKIVFRGRVDLTPLLTHTFSLEIEKGYEVFGGAGRACSRSRSGRYGLRTSVVLAVSTGDDKCAGQPGGYQTVVFGNAERGRCRGAD